MEFHWSPTTTILLFSCLSGNSYTIRWGSACDTQKRELLDEDTSRRGPPRDRQTRLTRMPKEQGPCAGRRGQKCPYVDEYGRPSQTCSKGKDKNTGGVVWRTTCSRCHKDRDGGTSGTRGQYSRPVVHQQREGDTASNQSDVLWDDDDDEWQRFRHEVDY